MSPTALVAATTVELLDFTRNMLCSLVAVQAQVIVRIVDLDAGGGVCSNLTAVLALIPTALCTNYAVQLDRTATRDVVWRSRAYYTAVRSKIDVFKEALISFASQDDPPDWVIFSDTDVVYHADPLPYLQREHANETRTLFSKWACAGSGKINSGWFAMRPRSNASFQLLQAAQRHLLRGQTYDHTDMGAIQASVNGRNSRLLSCDVVMSGHAINTLSRVSQSSLMVFHMNWVSASSSKKRCLQLTGQWLLLDAPGLCRPRIEVHTVAVAARGRQVRGCQLNESNRRWDGINVVLSTKDRGKV